MTNVVYLVGMSKRGVDIGDVNGDFPSSVYTSLEKAETMYSHLEKNNAWGTYWRNTAYLVAMNLDSDEPYRLIKGRIG